MAAIHEFLNTFLPDSEDAGLRLGGGEVTAYDSTSHLVTVLVDGSDVEIDMKHLQSYSSPTVGDIVVIVKNGGDWWVWDAFA